MDLDKAPIDIVKDIIKTKLLVEAAEEQDLDPAYREGLIDAYYILIETFDNFKKLFN